MPSAFRGPLQQHTNVFPTLPNVALSASAGDGRRSPPPASSDGILEVSTTENIQDGQKGAV